ncbi:hypothetical protein GEMRC1_001826 [Eukaryota sp. GEM-RC1]
MDLSLSLEELTEQISFEPTPSEFCECLLEEIIEHSLVEAIDIQDLLQVEHCLFDALELIDIVDEIQQTINVLEEARQKFKESLIEIYSKPLPQFESIQSSMINETSSSLDLFKTLFTPYIRQSLISFNELVDVVDGFLDCFDDLEEMESVLNTVDELSSTAKQSLTRLGQSTRKKKRTIKKKKKLPSSPNLSSPKGSPVKSLLPSTPKSVSISLPSVPKPRSVRSRSSEEELILDSPMDPHPLATPLITTPRNIHVSMSEWSISPTGKKNVTALKKLHRLYAANSDDMALSPMNSLAELPTYLYQARSFRHIPDDVTLILDDEEFVVPYDLLKDSLLAQKDHVIELSNIDTLSLEGVFTLLDKPLLDQDSAIEQSGDSELLDILTGAEALQLPSVYSLALSTFVSRGSSTVELMDIARTSFFSKIPIDQFIELYDYMNDNVILCLSKSCDAHALSLEYLLDTYNCGARDWISVYASSRISNFLTHFDCDLISSDEVSIWETFLGSHVRSIVLKGSLISNNSFEILFRCCPNLLKMELVNVEIDDLIVDQYFSSLEELCLNNVSISQNSLTSLVNENPSLIVDVQ